MRGADPAVWKYGKNEKRQRETGEEGAGRADKGAYEAAPHDTRTHPHTTQRDTTLITAEIDLTLLKTVCGGKEWDADRVKTQKQELQNENMVFRII